MTNEYVGRFEFGRLHFRPLAKLYNYAEKREEDYTFEIGDVKFDFDKRFSLWQLKLVRFHRELFGGKEGRQIEIKIIGDASLNELESVALEFVEESFSNSFS